MALIASLIVLLQSPDSRYARKSVRTFVEFVLSLNVYLHAAEAIMKVLEARREDVRSADQHINSIEEYCTNAYEWSFAGELVLEQLATSMRGGDGSTSAAQRLEARLMATAQKWSRSE